MTGNTEVRCVFRDLYQLALRLQTIDRELTENRAQLEQAEKTYKDLVKARDVAINAGLIVTKVICSELPLDR